jgi:hypothetical protein
MALSGINAIGFGDTSQPPKFGDLLSKSALSPQTVEKAQGQPLINTYQTLETETDDATLETETIDTTELVVAEGESVVCPPAGNIPGKGTPSPCTPWPNWCFNGSPGKTADEAKDGPENCGYPGPLEINGKVVSGLNVVKDVKTTNASTAIYDPTTGKYSIAGVADPELAELEFYTDTNGNVAGVQSVFNQNKMQITAITYETSSGRFLISTNQGSNMWIGPGSPMFNTITATFGKANVDLTPFTAATAAA